MTATPRTVLLIDDDEFLRDMYARKFREHDVSVEALGSAREALEKLRAGSMPDIIVFDIVMPGVDGFALLETLKKEGLGAQAVKVALTNQSSDEDAERAKALGAKAFLVKAELTPSEVIVAVLATAQSGAA